MRVKKGRCMVTQYYIREIVYTLQGEGVNAGRPAIMCRFLSNPLITTPPQHFVESNEDVKQFAEGEKKVQEYKTAAEVAIAIERAWPTGSKSWTKPAVVCTGAGLLDQLDDSLIETFHAHAFNISIEVDGTKYPPAGIDWITVKPRTAEDLVLRHGHELKVEYPTKGPDPVVFEELEFQYFFLQPRADQYWEENIRKALEYCLKHPHWRLALQIHRFLGLP